MERPRYAALEKRQSREWIAPVTRSPRVPTSVQPRLWLLGPLAVATVFLTTLASLQAADIAPALRWVPAGPAAATTPPVTTQPVRSTPHEDLVSRATLLASEGRWHEIVRLYEPAMVDIAISL